MKALIFQRLEQIIEKTLLTSLEKKLSFDFSSYQEEIEYRMDGIQKDMCSEREENIMITGRSTIEQALTSHLNAQLVLADVQLNSCQNCAVRFDETLSEAAEFYEFSLEQVLVALNGLGLKK